MLALIPILLVCLPILLRVICCAVAQPGER